MPRLPPRIVNSGWYALRFEDNTRKIRRVCTICGRPMWLPPSKADGYKTCGRNCGLIHQRKDREARRRKCETCGKDFVPRATQLRSGRGKFCSQKCNTARLAALFSREIEIIRHAMRTERRAAGYNRYNLPQREWDGQRYKATTIESRREYTESGRAAERLRKYRSANPDKVREFSQRRSTREKTGRLPRGTIKRIGEAQRWRCAICRVEIKAGYHVDHIVPLALDGTHIPANIQLLCPPCNLQKSSRDPIEHMRSLGRLL